jgi:AmmeMemoRadiSam system protein A
MTPEQGSLLLALARTAIAEAFGGPAASCPPHDGWLDEPAALFVSLYHRGALRGCVGSLEARQPLFRELVDKARAAAFADSRMPPLAAEELADLDIEITLLHPLEALPSRTEGELLAHLRPGQDGLLLRSREGSAVYIPKVWHQLPQAESFLRHLLRKAGIQGWPGDLLAFRFTAEEVPAAAPATVHGH